MTHREMSMNQKVKDKNCITKSPESTFEVSSKSKIQNIEQSYSKFSVVLFHELALLHCVSLRLVC